MCLAWSKTPDRYESGCVTTGRLSYAGQVKGDDPAEKGNLQVGGWARNGQTHSVKNICDDTASKMTRMGLEKKGGLLSGRAGPRRGYGAVHSTVLAFANTDPIAILVADP